MRKTVSEIAIELGAGIRQRRLGFAWTQADAAERAGVSYRTWRRMETEGKASIEDLVRAAIAMRCEQHLSSLFPEPVATSMDELLRQQAVATPKQRRRAPSRKITP